MVQALTNRTKEGVLYSRPPEVEAQIGPIKDIQLSDLVKLLIIRDRSSPKYLKSETLVHLIRDSVRSRDEQLMNVIAPVLFTRCETILNIHVYDSLPNVETFREDILLDFCEMLMNGQPDKLDYFEIKFHHAFRTFYVNAITEFIRKSGREAEPAVSSGENEDFNYDEAFAGLSSDCLSPETQPGMAINEKIYDALYDLPPDQCKAVVLHRILGYKIESENPDEKTVATLCNTTGRTIRNRLSRANKRLSKLKENNL